MSSDDAIRATMTAPAWWGSRDWREAYEVARYRAEITGARYRVRMSYAEPGRWLVMPIMPSQRWTDAAS